MTSELLRLALCSWACRPACCSFVRKPEKHAALKQIFYARLVVWFFLEVVLSYWWCFVTGADPLMDHTPSVVIFLGFNLAQDWGLKKLGVLGVRS